MKRKRALNFIGVLVIVVFTMSLAISCTNDVQEKATVTEEETVVEETVKETEVMSERDKLIINREIMNFADMDNPTDHELKHTPEITLGEKDLNGFTQVNVSIGQSGIIHPVVDNHWVDFITVYADNVKVGHIEYEAGLSRGYTSFFINLESVKEIKAEAGCNLHGIWQSALPL